MPSPLHLEFELGADRYLLPVARVAAVLPLPALKALPGAPAGVAGVLNYRGDPVPVIDLAALALGRPAEDRRGTRLVLVHYPAPDRLRLLGVIVERAGAVTRVDEATFRESGAPAAAWLGAVAAPVPPSSRAQGAVPAEASPPGVGGSGSRLMQRVEVEGLLPPDLRAVLFSAVEEVAAPAGEAAS